MNSFSITPVTRQQRNAGSPCGLRGFVPQSSTARSHENITPLMLVHRDLAAKEQNFRDQTEKLAESNIALKVLLEHRQKDRVQLEENMLANVRTLILPFIQ